MPYQTIEEYLSAKGYEPVKQSGHTLTYHCPIHLKDNTPSFFAKNDKWYCHGACGEGGDLLRLILYIEQFKENKQGWREACKIRDGERIMVSHKPTKIREKKRITSEQKSILSLMTQWWKDRLLANTYGAEEARSYLIYVRGIPNRVMGMGPIGYCPRDPDGSLLRSVFKMIEEGYGSEGILAAQNMGIFYVDQNGALHLSQQHRIVFSSLDTADMQTTYFQGRIISKEHLPGCYIGARGLPKAPFWIPIEEPVIEATVITESPLGPAALAAYDIPNLATLGNNPDTDFLAHFPGPKLWAQDNDVAGEKQAAKYQRYCEKESIPFYRLLPSVEEKDVDKWVLCRGIEPLIKSVRDQTGEKLFKASCFVL